MHISYLPPNELIPYEFNNKKHPEDQINKIANSIKECGFRAPILVDENNIILAGHGRLLGAIKLGMKEVPVIKYADLTEIQKKKYRILDNRLWDLAEYDLENLKIELLDIGDEELIEMFEDLDIPYENIKLPEDEDKEIEMPETPRVQRGDIFMLGDHLLGCVDITDGQEMSSLLSHTQQSSEGIRDAVITDPPYNVNYQWGTDQKLTIKNDNMKDADFKDFMNKVYKVFYDWHKPGGAIYVFHSDMEWETFRHGFVDAGYKLHQTLVRVKNHLIMWRLDYQSKHEPCLYGWKPGKAHNRYADRQEVSVLEYNKPHVSDIHPTMKPVDLIEYLVGNSTKKGDVVFDGFGGSGTTLVACEKLWRKCIMTEIDPRYCQAIIQRYQQLFPDRSVSCLTRDISELLSHSHD